MEKEYQKQLECYEEQIKIDIELNEMRIDSLKNQIRLMQKQVKNLQDQNISFEKSLELTKHLLENSKKDEDGK